MLKRTKSSRTVLTSEKLELLEKFHIGNFWTKTISKAAIWYDTYFLKEKDSDEENSDQSVNVEIKDDLEFDPNNGREFVRILLEVIVVDSPQLVYKAVRLLFRHFSKHEELIGGFKQIQLLVSAQDVENYTNMKEALDSLRIVLDTRIDRKKK